MDSTDATTSTLLLVAKAALGGTALAAAYALAERARYLRSLAAVPGPPFSFWSGAHCLGGAEGERFLWARHKVYEALHAEYGPVVKLVLPFGAGAMLLFADAAGAEAAMFKDSDSFGGRSDTAQVLEHGLLSLPTGEKWRTMRHAVLPSLSAHALRSYHPAILSRARALCATLESSAAPIGGGDRAASDEADVAGSREAGVVVSTPAEQPAGAWAHAEVSRPLVAATLDIIGDIGFGQNFGALAAEAAAAAAHGAAADGDDGRGCAYLDAGAKILDGWTVASMLPGPLVTLLRALPRPLMPASQRGLLDGLALYARTAKGLYEDACARYRQQQRDAQHAQGPTAQGTPPPAPDAVSFLEALAHAQLPFPAARDTIITLLLAGHETTANTLCWALHLLAAHPAEQARLRAEVDAVLGGADGPPSYEQLAKLGCLRHAFLESLRLFPTVPDIDRVCTRAASVCGVAVPVGTVCIYTVCVGARDAAVFDEPEAFRPQRHAPSGAKPQQPPASWLPFGAGARRCLGSRLAELEATVFLAEVLRTFELAPPEDGVPPPEEFTDLTLGPKRSGLRVRLRRRHAPGRETASAGTGALSSAAA